MATASKSKSHVPQSDGDLPAKQTKMLARHSMGTRFYNGATLASLPAGSVCVRVRVRLAASTQGLKGNVPLVRRGTAVCHALELCELYT